MKKMVQVGCASVFEHPSPQECKNGSKLKKKIKKNPFVSYSSNKQTF